VTRRPAGYYAFDGGERPRWYRLVYAISEGLVLLGIVYLLLVLLFSVPK
jgi:hypothetical protein